MPIQDFVAPGLGSFSAPPGIGGFRAPQEGNVFSRIIKDLMRDVVGGATVAGAAGGEALRLIGANVPLGWEDVEARDIRGAMMLAALGVGGVAGGAVRGALAIPSTALGRLGTTAAAEAAAGAAVGLLRPLEEDEDRLRAVIGDAAFGGAIGAGASMMRSAVMATVGAKVATMKATAARIRLGQAAALEHDRLVAKEIAGVRMLNPTSGEEIAIRRNVDGKVVALVYSGGRKTGRGIAAEDHGHDFGAAVAQAVKDGFTSELQPWDPKRALKGMEGIINPRVMEEIATADGNIIDALGNIDLGRYKAIREAADLDAEARTSLEALGVELLAPSTPLGAPALDDATRQSLATRLGLKQGVSDAVLLRESVRRGLVSVEGVAAGVKQEDLLLELLVNAQVPEGAVVVENKLNDLILGPLLTSKRIAALFPEVQPVFDMALGVSHKLRALHESSEQWLTDLRLLGDDAAAKGVTLIDDAGQLVTERHADAIRSGAMPVEAARAMARFEALAAAEATGDAGVIDFVKRVNERMEIHLQAMHAAGVVRPDVGLPGYFPIVNTNKWRLNIRNADGVQFQGFHPTREAALAEAARVRAKLGGKVIGTIAPQAVKFDRSELALIEPAQLGRTAKAIREGLTETLEEVFEETGIDIDAAVVARDAMMGRLAAKAAAPKRGTPFARRRQLGIRDFSASPYDALKTYFHSTERAIALREFEPAARAIVDALPPDQQRLRAWGLQYIDRMMGRPDAWEIGFDNVLTQLGIDVAPRALQRWTAAARKWVTFSRLGNPFSAAVNLSQIALNTNAVLGVRDTVAGFEVLMGRAKGSAIVKRMKDAGLDLGVFVPLNDEGMVAAFNGPKAALREGRYVEALYRMSMFMFNGAEKMNRAVTAWGAFKRGVREGMTDREAATFAEGILVRTQFDYGTHNMPALLNGPVGGILFQFKSFLLNEIDFIASMSPKEAARFGVAAQAMGGMALLMNMPGADVLDFASTSFMDKKLSERLAMEGGRGSGPVRALTHGLPGLFGVDMSDYLGVGSFSDLTRSLFGPAVGDAAALTEFIMAARGDIVSEGMISNETKDAFLQKAAPTVLRRFARGAEIARTGEMRNPYTGKLIYKPEVRLQAALLTAFGPPTLELQAERAADVVATRVRENYIQARNSFTKDAALAVLQRRPEDVKDILREAYAAGHAITAEDMRYWIAEMSAPAASRRQRRLPAAIRQENRRLFDVTGLHRRPAELGGEP